MVIGHDGGVLINRNCVILKKTLTCMLTIWRHREKTAVRESGSQIH